MTTFAPGSTDAFASGLFQGQPGTYPARDVWVTVATDSSVVGPTGETVLKVWFVTADYPTSHGFSQHDVTLTGSEQVSLQSPLEGEQFVRIEHVSGGPWFGRAYEEFTT